MGQLIERCKTASLRPACGRAAEVNARPQSSRDALPCALWRLIELRLLDPRRALRWASEVLSDNVCAAREKVMRPPWLLPVILIWLG